MVYRGPRRKGVRYFGPYSHAWAIRETLDLLTRVFPARTCSAGVFKRHNQIDRPCLLGYIDKCSAPCIGRVSAEEHRKIVLGLLRLPVRQDRPAGPRDGTADERRRRAARLRAGGAAAGQHLRAASGRWRSRPWCSATAPTPTWWRSPTTNSRPPCRCSTSAAAGCAASAAGSSKSPVIPEDSGQSTPGRTVPHPVLRRPGRVGRRGRRVDQPGAASGAGAGAAAQRRRAGDLAVPGCAGRGWRCGCRMRGDKRALAETVQAQRAGCADAAQAASAPATSPRDLLRCRAFRMRSGWPTRRCASNASTSATCRAPTWWRRWWCSRTGCRASPTTATTRSGRPRATAAPTTWRPSPR